MFASAHVQISMLGLDKEKNISRLYGKETKVLRTILGILCEITLEIKKLEKQQVWKILKNGFNSKKQNKKLWNLRGKEEDLWVDQEKETAQSSK